MKNLILPAILLLFPFSAHAGFPEGENGYDLKKIEESFRLPCDEIGNDDCIARALGVGACTWIFGINKDKEPAEALKIADKKDSKRGIESVQKPPYFGTNKKLKGLYVRLRTLVISRRRYGHFIFWLFYKIRRFCKDPRYMESGYNTNRSSPLSPTMQSPTQRSSDHSDIM